MFSARFTNNGRLPNGGHVGAGERHHPGTPRGGGGHQPEGSAERFSGRRGWIGRAADGRVLYGSPGGLYERQRWPGGDRNQFFSRNRRPRRTGHACARWTSGKTRRPGSGLPRLRAYAPGVRGAPAVAAPAGRRRGGSGGARVAGASRTGGCWAWNTGT